MSHAFKTTDLLRFTAAFLKEVTVIYFTWLIQYTSSEKH